MQRDAEHEGSEPERVAPGKLTLTEQIDRIAPSCGQAHGLVHERPYEPPRAARGTLAPDPARYMIERTASGVLHVVMFRDGKRRVIGTIAHDGTLVPIDDVARKPPPPRPRVESDDDNTADDDTENERRDASGSALADANGDHDGAD